MNACYTLLSSFYPLEDPSPWNSAVQRFTGLSSHLTYLDGLFPSILDPVKLTISTNTSPKVSSFLYHDMINLNIRN